MFSMKFPKIKLELLLSQYRLDTCSSNYIWVRMSLLSVVENMGNPILHSKGKGLTRNLRQTRALEANGKSFLKFTSLYLGTTIKLSETVVEYKNHWKNEYTLNPAFQDPSLLCHGK